MIRAEIRRFRREIAAIAWQEWVIFGAISAIIIAAQIVRHFNP